MATKTKPEAVFLLVLSGPVDEMPVKVFFTERDALLWAAGNPPVPVTGELGESFATEDEHSALFDAFNSGPGWSGSDTDDTSRPWGYRLYRFNSDGNVMAWAQVEPWNEYTPKPKKEYAVQPIDPEQELDWN